MTPSGTPTLSSSSGATLTIGEHYCASRQRLTDLLARASEADWGRPVPACPGWDVHDVVAHLVRLGRRTRQQVAALDWTPVPDEALLGSLFIFGPAAAPLVEEA